MTPREFPIGAKGPFELASFDRESGNHVFVRRRDYSSVVWPLRRTNVKEYPARIQLDEKPR